MLGLEVGLFRGEVFDALFRFEVVFHVVTGTGLVHPDESVRRITIHVPVSIGSSAVRHQDCHLMQRFRRLTPEVPHHIVGFAVGLRVSLLGVDEVRELNRVSDEENWSIVSNHVVVAFFCVEFKCESSGIARCIS